MEFTNQTIAMEIFLLGLSDDPQLQPMMFGLFLVIYLVTVFGNMLIILVINADIHLHTPMYFFISNLSLNDICMSTTTLPKMLMNIHTQTQRITYTGCLTQACFVVLFGGLESCLLASMAYDRYVAICHPLRYAIIMNSRLCYLLSLLSLLISILNALLLGTVMLWLSFCRDMEIPHFFCELTQVINLSCSDTFVSNVILYILALIFGGIPFSGIILSYVEIVSSVLKIPSIQGRYKAISTCGSHLSVVSLFYGTGLGVCVSSAVTNSPRKTAVASVMYSVVTQMLNPFIYSLRNRDMKSALERLISAMVSLT